jgi:hypothetical protein
MISENYTQRRSGVPTGVTRLGFPRELGTTDASGNVSITPSLLRALAIMSTSTRLRPGGMFNVGFLELHAFFTPPLPDTPFNEMGTPRLVQPAAGLHGRLQQIADKVLRGKGTRGGGTSRGRLGQQGRESGHSQRCECSLLCKAEYLNKKSSDLMLFS